VAAASSSGIYLFTFNAVNPFCNYFHHPFAFWALDLDDVAFNDADQAIADTPLFPLIGLLLFI